MDPFVVVVGFAAAIACIAYRGVRRRLQARQLAERGRTVAGRIVSLSAAKMKSVTRYMVAYEYEVEGRVYKGMSRLTRTQHDRLSQGGPIALVYLPDRPEVALPEFRLPPTSHAHR
jgi:hypothetical protein